MHDDTKATLCQADHSGLICESCHLWPASHLVIPDRTPPAAVFALCEGCAPDHPVVALPLSALAASAA